MRLEVGKRARGASAAARASEDSPALQIADLGSRAVLPESRKRACRTGLGLGPIGSIRTNPAS